MVLIIARPGVQNALRFIMWPFRSEMRMFLILSIFSLLVCILEMILYPELEEDLLDQSVEELPGAVNSSSTTTTANTLEDTEFSTSLLGVKSIFIPCVFGLLTVIFIVGRLLQFAFFGPLSELERRNLSRLLFRFAVFRVIILSGAINVSRLSSVFGWLVWFGAVGLLHACVMTAMSRCHQLAASSLVTRREWIRLSCALAFLVVGNWIVLRGGLSYCFLLADINVTDSGEGVVNGRSLSSAFKTPTALGVLKAKLTGRRELIYDAVDVVAYILAECMLLFCLIVHALGGFLIQAYDRWQLAQERSWPQQSTFSYYLDLIHVLVYRFIEIAHYLHLLLWSRIFSVASLIVFLHIRFAYSMLANRIRHHVAHRRLSRYIGEHFELRTTKSADSGSKKSASELSPNNAEEDSQGKPFTHPGSKDFSGKTDKADDPIPEACAICWEPMHTWRRLPCRHDFHESCLRSWLEQNPTCPTCRRDLGIPMVLLANANRNAGAAAAHEQAAMGLLLNNLVRHADGTLNHTAPADATATAGVRVVRPTTSGPAQDANNSVEPARNLYATAFGLNLGMSIGSAPVVAAAAHAAARDAVAPGTSNAPSSTSAGDQGSSGIDVLRPGGSNAQQATTTGDTALVEEDNQVRHRSFHFDGSRYFSWLPSLHVELSDVIREVFTAGADQLNQVVDDLAPRPTTNVFRMQTETVNQTGVNSMGSHSTDPATFNPEQYELIRLPATLRQPAQEISRMFPQFSLSVIVADLLRTGVPEVTVENLISRPPPPPSSPRFSAPIVRSHVDSGAQTNQDAAGTGASMATSSAPVASTSSPGTQTTGSPSALTETGGSEPETILARRRQFLRDQARARFFSRNLS